MNPRRGDVIVDATVGNAGHAAEFSKAVGDTGLVIGIDDDEAALQAARERLAQCPARFVLIRQNFRHFGTALSGAGVDTIQHAFFDLGLRSEYVEEGSGKGFSFRRDEPLDMRYGEHSPYTAAEIVNQRSEQDLAEIIRNYGEERWARSIARRIVSLRKEAPIVTTFQLVEAIAAGIPARFRHGRLHFATKTFQAVRIAANEEYEALREGVAQALEVLAPGGRVGVIAFHSGEDRITKQMFRARSQDSACWRLITKRPVSPHPKEIEENPKSRSAKLRVIERIS